MNVSEGYNSLHFCFGPGLQGWAVSVCVRARVLGAGNASAHSFLSLHSFPAPDCRNHKQLWCLQQTGNAADHRGLWKRQGLAWPVWSLALRPRPSRAETS